MDQKRQKDDVLFDYTNKIFSLQTVHLVKPFPKDIYKLISTYFQLCYHICVFPFRLVYNSETLKFEAKTAVVQRVVFIVLWACSLIRFSATLFYHIVIHEPKRPLDVLLLLGGVGHLGDYFIFLMTLFYYKEDIAHLVNFLFAYSTKSEVGTIHDSFLRDINPSNIKKRELVHSLTYKRMAILLWIITLIAGIHSSEISKLVGGVSSLKTFSEITQMFPNLREILNSKTVSSYILNAMITIIMIISHMEKMCGIFIYGLELMVVLTMKYVASHFTASLSTSTDIWKPSSDNILSSFLIVRQCYRMVNRIFGWMLFYTIMGEFPNFTFYVVFWYNSPNAPLQGFLTCSLLFVLLLLTIAAFTINELGKLKEWMHFENKTLWSSLRETSLQRKAVLFELSLNRYALYAHGFFQLSLPAFVSIATGILSNALIIIQLDISNSQ